MISRHRKHKHAMAILRFTIYSNVTRCPRMAEAVSRNSIVSITSIVHCKERKTQTRTRILTLEIAELKTKSKQVPTFHAQVCTKHSVGLVYGATGCLGGFRRPKILLHGAGSLISRKQLGISPNCSLLSKSQSTALLFKICPDIWPDVKRSVGL